MKLQKRPITALVGVASTKTGELTMSSLQIANYTEKEHFHVMRDIRIMLERLEIGASPFAGTYLDSQGKEQPCFYLPEEECLTLVSGYDLLLRNKIVKEWLRLKKENAPKVLSGVEYARKLLALEEEKETLENSRRLLISEAKIMKPKADGFDEIASAEGSIGIRKTAKVLGLKLKTFTKIMSEEPHRWLFKDFPGDSWNAYADKLAKGFLVHRTIKDKVGVLRDQCRFTALGLTKAAFIFNVNLSEEEILSLMESDEEAQED